jgi:hypothetical protein
MSLLKDIVLFRMKCMQQKYEEIKNAIDNKYQSAMLSFLQTCADKLEDQLI